MATLIHFFEIFPLHPLYLVLFLSFLFLYKWLYTSQTVKKQKPPSPPKLPILGNLHQLGKLLHRSLQSLAQKHGELMFIYIGAKPTLVVSSAVSAQEIMKTHDVIFANRPKLKVACKILYDAKDLAFSSYGEYWRQMKSLCMLNVFSNTKVRSFREVREEEAGLIVEEIRGLKPLEAVNLSEIFLGLSYDVICRAAFGRKYTGEEGCANLGELLKDFSAALGTFCMQDFIPWLGWVDWFTGVHRKAEKVASALDSFIEQIVQEHLDHTNLGRKDSAEANQEGKVRCFVDILLDVQRENPSVLPKESVKAILLDMLAGGTETTYTLLEWAMTELLLHPQAMKQLQHEVRGLTQGKTRVNEDDLKNMNYLKAVIKETLRLHPPLPLLLFRESSQDVKIKGYEFEVGTQVIINAWAIQRDPTYWEEPEEFKPERFFNSSVDFKGNDFEFIPFGAGRRGCPGMSFGLIDVELMLATLANEFNWKIADEQNFNVIERAGTTIAKRDPLLAIATPFSNKQNVPFLFQ